MKKRRIQTILIASLLILNTACSAQSVSPTESEDGREASSSSQTSENSSSVSSKPENIHTITVDFSKRAGAPLVKKFGFFNSGLVSLERTEQDIPAIDSLSAESLRVELGMGRSDMIFHDLVTGSTNTMQYNWGDIDRFAGLLTSRGVLPYFAYGYCPYPLQITGEDSRSQPSDLKKWQEILRTISSHFKDQGIRIGYHEIWNEPDCNDVFYTGSWEEYCDLYAYGARGIREGDPEAVVGGPSTAWVMSPGNRYKDFLSYVRENNLPLDFFSMHRYGTDSLQKIESVRQELENAGKYFETTAIHVNELNIDTAPWNYGEICDQYEMAPAIFRTIDQLVAQNDVEVISWAQFLESGVDALGVIDEAGHKKAAYNAFAIYARMPIDRCSLSSSTPLVSGMASADGQRACALVWNDDFNLQEVSLSLENLPFSSGTLTLYRIDEENASFGNNAGEELLPVETIEFADTEDLSWSGKLPPEAVVYIEVNGGRGESSLEYASPEGACILRQEHYYPTRGESNYAYFDETTWTARLGSGETQNAHSVVGVLAESLPDTIQVSFDIEGEPEKQGKNSLLGLRVDFATENGYEKSVLFHGGIYDKNRESPLPWGADGIPMQAEERELSDFSIDLSKYAPKNWNGKTLLIFEMQDCGENVSVRVSLR